MARGSYEMQLFVSASEIATFSVEEMNYLQIYCVSNTLQHT